MNHLHPPLAPAVDVQPRKKVDSRVRTLIENGVKTHTRSFFVLVGDRGKDQVANLHYILTKAQVKARPSVLWCYSKELGFSTCVPRVQPACALRVSLGRAGSSCDIVCTTL